MNISAVNNIDTNSITSQINDMTLGKTNTTENFSDVLSSMMNSIDETNDLQNTAEEKEIQFTSDDGVIVRVRFIDLFDIKKSLIGLMDL